MKPYGEKPKGPCACEYCGDKGKKYVKRRARAEGKKHIRDELKEPSKKGK